MLLLCKLKLLSNYLSYIIIVKKIILTNNIDKINLFYSLIRWKIKIVYVKVKSIFTETTHQAL